MRLVVDTDVIVAAMRSPGGASAALLVLLLERQATMLLSAALAFEYEATCMRAEHILAARASEADVRRPIETIIDVIGPVEVHYQWRPQLLDPGDELVLEAATNGRADSNCDVQSQGLWRCADPFRDRSSRTGGSIEERASLTTKVTTVSLRLPLSLKAAIEKLAAADGISVNQFLVLAAAE